MTTFGWVRAIVCAAACLSVPGLTALRAQTAPIVTSSSAEGARVIVKYRAGSALLRTEASPAAQKAGQAQALAARIGVPLAAGRLVSERSHVVTAQGIGSVQLAARIAAERDVEYAVVDGRKRVVAVPNDPFYLTRPVGSSSGGPLVGQWYLRPPQTTGAPASINAEQAWDVTTGSPAVIVAVLDTGVRFDHPDLAANLLPGYDTITDDRTAGDAQAGRDADASDPGDFVTSADVAAGAPGCEAGDVGSSSSWHGTQTAGLVAAITDNGAGIASVGRTVRVLPVRVLGKCGGTDSDIVAAMRWAAGIAVPGLPTNPNRARVINLSLGSSDACSAAYLDAVNEVAAAGVTVVASAGNSAGHAVGSPASCAGVIAVAALRHVGDKVGFSDLGPQIALSAPGGNCVNVGVGQPCLYPIATTSNAGATTPIAGAAGAIYTDSFRRSLGTSFSSPLVAGAAALMLSVQPTLTPAEVRSRLQSTARPFPTTGGTAGIPVCAAPSAADQLECYCTTATCGAGMLDVRAAVLAATSVQARIAVDTAAPVAGQPIAFSSSSIVASGRTIAAYQWALVDGGGIVAAFTSATNASTASVTASGAGTFTVSLTTTDDLGFVSTATASVVVAAAPVVVVPPVIAPPPSNSSSSGGGGALGAGWLLLLLLAVAALSAAAPGAARKG